MTSAAFCFADFRLDLANRRLLRGGSPVELNARYLDALALLVGEAGRLVSKDRFMDEVWRGVPVTDEALTQCVKTLRRQLGDSASAPRFIETVPKHGYRFIAAVEAGDANAGPVSPARVTGRSVLPEWLLLGGAGTVGAGMAGFIGGIAYGFAGASQPLQPGMGAISVLLVVMCLTILAALMGGAGVAFGIAAARALAGPRSAWIVAGGAAGGMIVGALVKLLGLDAFNLLLGRAPGDITGGIEGLVLGGAVGLGAWLAGRRPLSLRATAAVSALAGGAGGLVVALFGGRLMGGSLDLLARSFPGSQLRLDQLGALLDERGFGPVARAVTGTFEGALFGACLVGAMLIARRGLARER